MIHTMNSISPTQGAQHRLESQPYPPARFPEKGASLEGTTLSFYCAGAVQGPQTVSCSDITCEFIHNISQDAKRLAEATGPKEAIDVFEQAMARVQVACSYETNMALQAAMTYTILEPLSKFSADWFDYFVRDKRFLPSLNALSAGTMLRLFTEHKTEVVDLFRQIIEACTRKSFPRIPDQIKLSPEETATALTVLLRTLPPDIQSQLRDLFLRLMNPQNHQ